MKFVIASRIKFGDIAHVDPSEAIPIIDEKELDCFVAIGTTLRVALSSSQ